jgi:hypothetical protein
MRPGSRALTCVALGLALAVGGLFASPARAAADEQACTESFERVRKAIEARSADQVAGCMAADGTLTVSLLGLAAQAEPMKREQALKVLKTYFAQVTSASLKVKEGQAADSLVRSFDYTRRLKQNDPATTRLTITLRKDGAGVLRLHSLVESSK